MKRRLMGRRMRMLVSGALVMQIGACNLEQINQTVQTVLLGVTAAGAIVIIRNV